MFDFLNYMISMLSDIFFCLLGCLVILGSSELLKLFSYLTAIKVFQDIDLYMGQFALSMAPLSHSDKSFHPSGFLEINTTILTLKKVKTSTLLIYTLLIGLAILLFYMIDFT